MTRAACLQPPLSLLSHHSLDSGLSPVLWPLFGHTTHSPSASGRTFVAAIPSAWAPGTLHSRLSQITYSKGVPWCSLPPPLFYFGFFIAASHPHSVEANTKEFLKSVFLIRVPCS